MIEKTGTCAFPTLSPFNSHVPRPTSHSTPPRACGHQGPGYPQLLLLLRSIDPDQEYGYVCSATSQHSVQILIRRVYMLARRCMCGSHHRRTLASRRVPCMSASLAMLSKCRNGNGDRRALGKLVWLVLSDENVTDAW